MARGMEVGGRVSRVFGRGIPQRGVGSGRKSFYTPNMMGFSWRLVSASPAGRPDRADWRSSVLTRSGGALVAAGAGRRNRAPGPACVQTLAPDGLAGNRHDLHGKTTSFCVVEALHARSVVGTVSPAAQPGPAKAKSGPRPIRLGRGKRLPSGIVPGAESPPRRCVLPAFVIRSRVPASGRRVWLCPRRGLARSVRPGSPGQGRSGGP